MSRCDIETPLKDNLYAFLGWVVAYSDYGRELTVDTVLKRCRLLDKIDENKMFKSATEFKRYEVLLEEYKEGKLELGKIDIKLTEYEINRCNELKSEFTPRFERAKKFTIEQLGEYKIKKDFFNEDYGDRGVIDPVKMVDHETGEVVEVFKSTTEAAKVLDTNVRKIRAAIKKEYFYKGYVWFPCEMES